jgi:hypothetical protein
MFAAYAQDSMITRYLTFRPHTSPSEAHAVIEGFLARWQAQTEFYSRHRRAGRVYYRAVGRNAALTSGLS